MNVTLCSAAERYDLHRDPYDHIMDEVLPADPGVIHAVREFRPPTRATILSWGKTAICGKTVKVLYPQKFDPDAEDACPRCSGKPKPVVVPPEITHRMDLSGRPDLLG